MATKRAFSNLMKTAPGGSALADRLQASRPSKAAIKAQKGFSFSDIQKTMEAAKYTPFLYLRRRF